MRIVSQNRDFSFDFERTVLWIQSNAIYEKVGTESIAIGMYESEQRAKAVFSDIHSKYEQVSRRIYYMPEK